MRRASHDRGTSGGPMRSFRSLCFPRASWALMRLKETRRSLVLGMPPFLWSQTGVPSSSFGMPVQGTTAIDAPTSRGLSGQRTEAGRQWTSPIQFTCTTVFGCRCRLCLSEWMGRYRLEFWVFFLRPSVSPLLWLGKVRVERRPRRAFGDAARAHVGVSENRGP